jgi:hypothetical protein
MKQFDLPPMDLLNKNVSDMGRKILPIESYEVLEWMPELDGKGNPTQIHILMNIKNSLMSFCIRIKSPEECDRMIATLQRHRESVWGKST